MTSCPLCRLSRTGSEVDCRRQFLRIMSSLPLKSCDRRTREGLRDYAILLILARLGLRCHEVVYMRLEDLDWDQGEVIIRGKGCRSDRLPVPEDVGAAIATYLRRGRPQCADRRLFVRVKAPHKGFSGSCAVGDLLRRAAVRAGFKPSLPSARTACAIP